MEAGRAIAELREHLVRPVLLVLSGPSGAGKTTLIREFCARRDDYVASVSATTRPRRAGEVAGRDYHFVDQETFAAMVAADELLEHAAVFGEHHYGTPRAFVEERFAAGRSVVMDVDVQGAAQIRERWPDPILVFVLPPDGEELRRRLAGRGTEDKDLVRRRLAEAARELASWRDYDYLLVNDELGQAVERLDAVATAAAQRVRRAGAPTGS